MKIISYLTHKHTSNDCAISVVSVWRWPVASITCKNPVAITGGNCKPSPIISSNLLVWARVSRLQFRASVNFRGPKHIALLQAYPPFRGVLCPLVVIVMLFVKYDNSLLTDSLNGQIASNSINCPAICSNISSVREERYTILHEWWPFNENNRFRTLDSYAPGEPGHWMRRCYPKG